MTEWDGRGLPPAAQQRMERAARDHVRTSLLSTAGTVALADVGFEPVGEVMGCVVEHIGFGGYGCGVYTGLGGGFGVAPTRTSGSGGYGGYAPYVQALYFGYEVALHRMLLEAQALGADGVVDVRWTKQRLDDAGNREFVAMGTAVRGRCESRPAHLFSTDLAGQDVAKLLHGGWVPTGLAVGIAVAIRHDDYATRMQARPWSSGNVEVDGYTELVTFVRADARHQFAAKATRHSGDAAIVSAMTLDVWEIEPSDNHRDHVAESTVVGTAIARFHGDLAAPTRSLTVLPLNRPDRRR